MLFRSNEKMQENIEEIRKGLIYFQSKNYVKAEKIFLNLIRTNPTNQKIYGYLIPILIEQKKFENALKFSERFYNINKKNELGLIYIGIINYKLNRISKALEFFEKSLIINPNNVDALVNIGVTYRKLGDIERAQSYLEKSLKLNNNKPIVFYNLGLIYEDEGDFNKAIELYKKSISLNNKDYDSIHALSLCQLTMQNFKEGLKNYEFRWNKKNFEKYRHANIPKLISVNSISGKKILVWYEQGLGDTIQFSRYIGLLTDLGAKVTFEVQKPLLSFLKRQLNCNVIGEGSIEKFDYQCPLMTLPNLFDFNLKNVPSIKKYFVSDVQKLYFWRNKLKLSENKKNIGIAISGNPNQINENRRKIALEYFLPLTRNFRLFIIQKSLYENDEKTLMKSKDIVFLGGESDWNDFEDTSAIVQNMDCIVSICTSLIHLSSSMNKESYLLLSKQADWRWSSDKLETPIWYDKTVIIRQNKTNNWEDVILKLQDELN